MTKITKEDVRKVANLARLNLPDDKVDTYTNQLEEIMNGLNDAAIMLKEKKLVHTKINIKSVVQKFK